MVFGSWEIVATPIPDTARLKRSYERNLGHSRFWAGVGTVLLAALLLFIANTLWEIGTDPKVRTPSALNARKLSKSAMFRIRRKAFGEVKIAA